MILRRLIAKHRAAIVIALYYAIHSAWTGHPIIGWLDQ